MYINDTRREERKKKTYTLKESHRSTRKPAASSVTRAIISSFANDVRLGSPPVWSCHSRITSTFSLPSPRCCTPSYGPRQASCSEYACFRSTNGSHDVERKHTIGGNCRTHTHEIQIREIATRIRFSPLSLSASLCVSFVQTHTSRSCTRVHTVTTCTRSRSNSHVRFVVYQRVSRVLYRDYWHEGACSTRVPTLPWTNVLDEVAGRKEAIKETDDSVTDAFRLPASHSENFFFRFCTASRVVSRVSALRHLSVHSLSHSPSVIVYFRVFVKWIPRWLQS